MLPELFFIINILSSVIAASKNFIDSGKPIWIYNEKTNLCLYTSGIEGDTIYCEVCRNSDNYKWYLNTEGDGIQIMSVSDMATCISYDNNEIVLGECTDESKTTTTISTTTAKATPTITSVWLYNEYTNSCLYAPEYENENPIYKTCDDTDEYQWYIVNIKGGSYFKSKSNPDLCIRVSDNDSTKLLMGECDDNAILRYHKGDKTIVSKLSEDLCLGNPNNESTKLKRKAKLYDCSEEIHNDQIWTLNSSKPSKKSTTTTITTTTTAPTTTSTIYPYIVDTAEGSYFKSKINSSLCIRVSDYDRSKLEMGKCDDNAILRYRKNNKSIVSKFSTELCLGKENIDDNSTTRKIITLYDCMIVVKDHKTIKYGL
eukprot:jgi/Orpsp1_1/1187063/evm.model.d7180000055146.1